MLPASLNSTTASAANSLSLDCLQQLKKNHQQRFNHPTTQQLYQTDNAVTNPLADNYQMNEDERALQLALELTMLCLNPQQSKTDTNSDGNLPTFNNGMKSQNTTECVPVPSSEHVAEIVGRQGSKIKGLRAKTNTYIKTPVRGEEPVFVVTGRKEDVLAAKQEILSAAQHFTHLRLQRKNNLINGNGFDPNTNFNPNSLPTNPAQLSPGHKTIHVRVPFKAVGLVVGPRGATIKRIQQETNTYIITPSRDKDSVFEITGYPESVEKAKREIEAHIANRIGASVGPKLRFI